VFQEIVAKDYTERTLVHAWRVHVVNMLMKMVTDAPMISVKIIFTKLTRVNAGNVQNIIE
jgi:hypothetical protein